MSPQIASNRRRVAALLAVLVAAVVLVGLAVDAVFDAGPAVLVVALLVAAAVAAVVYFASDRVALGLCHATPAGEDTHPRYHNLVEGLCIAAGLPKPELYVIDDPAPNAFATGRNPSHAAVAVTTGLLEKMNRVELEGVLAHELSHIRSHDTLVSTMAVTLAGPLGAPLLRWVLPRRHELTADTTGVNITRYPPGLISALEKLSTDPTSMRARSRATAHLWIAQPPLDERIKALRSM